MNDRFLLHVAVLVAFASAGRAEAGPAPAMITHRLADERAIALHLPVTPTAVIGDTTRYVLSPPVAASIPLSGVPRAARDGTLTVDVPCPAAFAGREAILSLSVPVPAATSTIRTRCPSAGGTVRMVVSGVTPGMPIIANANAVGLPERLETGWLSPRPGARLRAAIGLAGSLPGERPAPVRFRVLAEGQRKQPPLTLLVRPVDAASPGERGWLDIDVPLDPARALGTFRLVFDAELTGASAGFPVWGDPMVLEPAPARNDVPWNVLLVSIDTLRADRLGCYGNRRATSPAIDAVANAGARFAVAVAPAPWTLPSHVSMMTGLYPCAHGLVSPDLTHPLNPAVRPLAAVLRPRGYATAAFTEDAFVDPNVFQRGFGFFRADPGSIGPDRVERTTGGARDWVRQVAGTPFFLFVHTYQVHALIRVPSRYYQMFTTWDGPDGPRPLAEGPPGTQELTTYDTAIRYTDETLGGLLATLDELDLARRTVVVVTSDHGEAFWEHDFAGHGKTLYEEEIRIPLVIRAPGLVEPGRRVPEIASLVDVLPTVLELLGVQPPTPIQGRSFASLIRAGTPPPTASAERIVFVENSLKSPQFAVRGSDWKGIFEDPAPVRIFKLDGDPREQRPDESGALVETASGARRRFEGECTRTRDAITEAARNLPAPPPITPDPARQERLRALGYTQ